MNEPSRIDPDKLSFDIFHDLMHRPFTAECWAQYGGPRRHLRLWWDFVVRSAIGRATRRRVGRRRWCDGWSSELGDCRICGDCQEREK